MNDSYKLTYGNWELTITEAEPGRQLNQPNATHVGKAYFKGEYFAEYANRALARPNREVETKEWGELFEVPLTRDDIRDFECLERAADDLCLNLNEGYSMESWCKSRGIELPRQMKQTL